MLMGGEKASPSNNVAGSGILGKKLISKASSMPAEQSATTNKHYLILLIKHESVPSTASKINDTPKGVYSPISKLQSILVVANLLAHNNKSQICYCGQISLQSAAVNCSFSDTFGGNIYFAGDGALLD